MLNIPPSRIIAEGIMLPIAKKPAACSEIDIGYNDHYLQNINEMIRITIRDLLPIVDLLIDLKSIHALEYCLEVVPEIASESDDIKPNLSLEPDIIAFLHQTGTIYDLDYYVY
ncbi:MAG: hypothetical protein IJX53_03325 [Clostridia bacterium]|nr:hypothetical protein [Clostridia bacterium]